MWHPDVISFKAEMLLFLNVYLFAFINVIYIQLIVKPKK